MKRRDFVKNTGALATIAFLPSCTVEKAANGKIRTAHIGLGAQGIPDLRDIASHPSVEVAALCDVYEPYVLRDASRVHQRYLDTGKTPKM